MTTKIRHTLYGSVYSPLWEALSKCDVPHGLLCIYGVVLGWGSGGFCSLSWERSPAPPTSTVSLSRPGESVYHTGRTAGLHGRSNCHLLSCAPCTLSTEIKSKKKKTPPLHPSTLPRRQNSSLLWDGVTTAPPSSVFCDPRCKEGCVSVC